MLWGSRRFVCLTIMQGWCSFFQFQQAKHKLCKCSHMIIPDGTCISILTSAPSYSLLPKGQHSYLRWWRSDQQPEEQSQKWPREVAAVHYPQGQIPGRISYDQLGAKFPKCFSAWNFCPNFLMLPSTKRLGFTRTCYVGPGWCDTEKLRQDGPAGLNGPEQWRPRCGWNPRFQGGYCCLSGSIWLYLVGGFKKLSLFLHFHCLPMIIKLMDIVGIHQPAKTCSVS